MQVAIFLQLIWVIASIFWNLTSLDMVETGELVPVSISFITSIFILVVIGLLLLIFYYFKLSGWFKIVSLLGAFYAGFCLYEIFSTDPNLWDNASWEWGAAGLNLFGLIACLAAVFGRLIPRSYRPDPISPIFNDPKSSN
jgi:hypothetical protein